jgi:hypothetical protein
LIVDKVVLINKDPYAKKSSAKGGKGDLRRGKNKNTWREKKKERKWQPQS